jgi:hypothetical protein
VGRSECPKGLRSAALGPGYHYIVASRQGERSDHFDDFEDASGFVEVIREVSPNNLAQKKSRVRIKRKVNLPTSDGNVLSIRRATAPEATHRNLYNLLGISSDIIKPVRTLKPTIVTQARS